MRSTLIALCAAVLLVAALSSPIHAKRDFLDHLRSAYGLGENAKCNICHDLKDPKAKPSKKTLGAMGKDYQTQLQKFGKNNLDAVLKAIENLDSDGDGATNLEELRLGTIPSDASSMPAKADLEKYRKLQEKTAKKK